MSKQQCRSNWQVGNFVARCCFDIVAGVDGVLHQCHTHTHTHTTRKISRLSDRYHSRLKWNRRTVSSCSSVCNYCECLPVLVTGPPHLVTSRYVRRHLVRPGDRLRLPCPVRANPPALVTWYKDGGTIHLGWDRYRVRADDWTLSVRDVQLDDTGIFTCRATNGFGSIDITYLVFVSREF